MNSLHELSASIEDRSSAFFSFSTPTVASGVAQEPGATPSEV